LLVKQKLMSCFEIRFFPQNVLSLNNEAVRSSTTRGGQIRRIPEGFCFFGTDESYQHVTHFSHHAGNLMFVVFCFSHDRGFLKGNTAGTAFSGTTAWPLNTSSPIIV
jgi:hypothetical protein